jgi:hypothetical protein
MRISAALLPWNWRLAQTRLAGGGRHARARWIADRCYHGTRDDRADTGTVIRRWQLSSCSASASISVDTFSIRAFPLPAGETVQERRISAPPKGACICQEWRQRQWAELDPVSVRRPAEGAPMNQAPLRCPVPFAGKASALGTGASRAPGATGGKLPEQDARR